MKIEEPIMGFAVYNEKDYPFIYEQGILKLMPSSVQEWHENQHMLLRHIAEWGKKVNSNEWIGTSYISASAHNGNRIIFLVSNDTSNNNGFISFSVIYFLEYRKDEISADSISGYSVSGREINDFYNPSRAFETEILYEDKRIMSTNVKVPVKDEIEVGFYEYQGNHVNIFLDTIPTYHLKSDKPLSASSKMKFIFSNPQKLDFVMDVFLHCKKFIYYVCGRTNIQIDDIQVYAIRDGKISNEGAIRICSHENEDEPDMKRDRKIIKYEYLKDKICLLFAAIADGSMYFENLCSSIQATHSFGIDRIILNFVAFEREFRNLYDDEFVRSDEYNEVKENVLEYLAKLKDANTGKKKKYIKSFISTFEKTENKYADRMNKALVDCEEILMPFLQYNYQNYNSGMIEGICDRMNKLRNDSAHGNIDLAIEPIHISDFATLENLLYAMRLKNIGVELLNIRRAIRDLKNYNVLISEKE